MASNTINLSQFRAAGVYTVVIDQTESVPLVTSPVIRLLVGFSKTGPFNVPVFLNTGDIRTAQALFGDVDGSLERNGSWFHRMLFSMLETGPVLALNLLSLDNTSSNGVPAEESDAVEYKSFSLDINELNGENRRKLLAAFYNKERFWFADRDYLLAARSAIDTNSLLSLVNTSQTPMSFIVRKPIGLTGYDITAREWYAADNQPVPPYVKDGDYIKDYFLEVVAIQGNYGPDRYAQLSIDPLFGTYFTKSGLNTSNVDGFLNLPEVNVLQTYTGCVIPGFRDKRGVGLFLEDLINQSTQRTGILCAIDQKELDKYASGTNTKSLDLVGHSLLEATPTDVDFLSYRRRVSEDLTYNEETGDDVVITADADVTDGVVGVDSSGVITLTGTTGSITAITVDGVNILSSTVNFNSDLPTTAGDVASNITGGVGTHGYSAIASSASVTISIPGSAANTRAIAITTTGDLDISQANPAMSGGVDEVATTASIVINSGSQGTITQIAIGGTNLLEYPVIFDTDPATYAATLASRISAYKGTSNWEATSSGTTLNLTTVSGSGGLNNGDSITVTQGTLGDMDFENTGVSVEANPANNGFTVTVLNTNPDFSALTNGISLGSQIKGTVTAAGTSAGLTISTAYMTVNRVSKLNDRVVFDVTSALKENETTASGSFLNLATANVNGGSGNGYTAIFNPNRFIYDSTGTYFIADPGSQIYKDFISGAISDGDFITDGTNTHYVKMTEGVDTFSSLGDYRPVLRVQFFTDTNLSVAISNGAGIAFGTSEDSQGYTEATAGSTIVRSTSASIDKRFEITQINDKVVRTPIANEPEITINDFIVGTDGDGNDVLSRITQISRVGTPSPTHIDITTQEVTKIYTTLSGTTEIRRFKPFDTFFDSYNLTYLPGFSLKERHLPNGTNARIQAIYQVLDDTNLASALADPDMIDFRYIVDSFNGGIEVGSKAVLSNIAKNRQTCLAILNCPSVRQLLDSVDPRFTKEPTDVDPVPVLNMQYVKDGGNLTLNPTNRYSLPEEVQGASHSAFYFPNIIVNDAERTLSVPPAAYVSNAFMIKHDDGNPYSVVAGRRRGNIIGDNIGSVEYELSESDRGFLEEKGINPIINSRNGGIQIFGNKTAYQRIRSSLNSVHVRETLIEVTINIENILSNYLFEFNNAATRTEITSLVTTYLTTLRDSIGILSNFEVRMDAVNNPREVEIAGYGIIDVSVAITGALERFVNRLTISRDGNASAVAESGGFIIA